ncbi:MAG: winged helix-turn-helix domain-containing protein [Firmicutes bacterium HGW-Firmicutes-19]|jgi:hypothetical protein|nr:MAG: winged helix-turn-helix domain-containing protein [Firmicutes bacterium HGW-Firmicutes-19]
MNSVIKMKIQTIEKARHYLLAYHGLLNEPIFEGKTGITDFVKLVGCVQFDPIDICGRNADLTFQSRVRHYKKSMLEELLYQDRSLMDYFDKNLSIILTADWPLMSRRREQFRKESRSSDIANKHEQMILDYLSAHDVACSKDIDLKERADWYWSASSSARVVLETLYFRGDLVIHHKKGTIKYYSKQEHLFNNQLIDQSFNDDEHDDLFLLRRIKAVGLLWDKPSDALLGILDLKSERRKAAFKRLLESKKITCVNIDGIKDSFYIPMEHIDLFGNPPKIRQTRTEFLAPLDNLLWDRKLISAIFDFDYKWEIYEPEHKRKHGYYVIPVIQDNAFVGRIEAINQKKTKTLLIKRFWQEKPINLESLEECIERFALFNQAKHIEYADDWIILTTEGSSEVL